MERVLSVESVYGSPARPAARAHRELAFGFRDAGESGRREHERVRQRAPEQRGGRVDGADVAQDARPEGRARERFGVLAHRVLVFRAAVDVVEHSPRQPASGHDAEIVHRSRAPEPPFSRVEFDRPEPQDRPQCFEHL